MKFINRYYTAIVTSLNLTVFGLTLLFVINQAETNLSATIFFSSGLLMNLMLYIKELKRLVKEK